MEWRISGKLPGSTNSATGVAGPVAGVNNNVLLIAGGANFPDSMPWQGGIKKYHDDVFVYRKQEDSLELSMTSKLPHNVAYAAVCTTPTGVCYLGGENEKGLSEKSWLMTFRNNTVNFTPLPDLPLALTNAMAASINSTVYVAGGEHQQGVGKQLLKLDLQSKNGWTRLADIPKAVSHAVLLPVSNSKLLLIGGRRKTDTGISEFFSTVFEYNIENNSWSEATPLPYPISALSGYTDGNKVYVFGGDRGETFHEVEVHLSAINREEIDSIKKRLIAKKNELLESHPGFSKEVLVYDLNTKQWTVAGTIPFQVPVTTTAVRFGKQVLIPSGEIRAGVRTQNILSVTLP